MKYTSFLLAIEETNVYIHIRFPVTHVSSTYKTGQHDITEILLKVALNTIQPNQTLYECTHLSPL
jgi:hypothetical protein